MYLSFYKFDVSVDLLEAALRTHTLVAGARYWQVLLRITIDVVGTRPSQIESNLSVKNSIKRYIKARRHAVIDTL